MSVSRRQLLALGGGVIATLAGPAGMLRAGAPAGPTAGAASETTVEIVMRASPRGERVWFSPQGLAIAPGTRIRFVNHDAGNSHTATAYHPQVNERPRRIPTRAEPWDSGYLLPEQGFEVVLTAPGVYDYYCQPHEMAGMVGRIVVGQPTDPGWEGPATEAGDLMPEVLAAFPPVDRILAERLVDAGGVE